MNNEADTELSDWSKKYVEWISIDNVDENDMCTWTVQLKDGSRYRIIEIFDVRKGLI